MANSPLVIKGALVALLKDDFVGFTPSVVLFQFNPQKLSRTLHPYDAASTEGRDAVAPGVQPFDPNETINLEIEMDAADGLERYWPLQTAYGVQPRIAALEKMTLPSHGLIGDVLGSVSDLREAYGAPPLLAQPERPSLPITLFLWGRARFVPVRISAYSVEEQFFSPILFPLQAKVKVTLQVLTPAAFACVNDDPIAKFAKAVYSLNRLQQDALATLHTANTITDFITQFVP